MASTNKTCPKCEKDKHYMAFRRKAAVAGWCHACCREHAGTPKTRYAPETRKRNPGSGRPSNESRGQERRFRHTICLHCERRFASEIFIGFGGHDDYYRICLKCTPFVNGIAQAGIDHYV
jgi:hypothetical protein